MALAYNGARYVGNGFQRFLGCGGTLVAPTIVITAAHCVFDPGIGWREPGLFEVISGRTVLSSAAGQALGVAAIYRPVRGPGGAPAFEAIGGPEVGPSLYRPKRSKWDVAFLVLAGPSAAPATGAGRARRASATAAGRWWSRSSSAPGSAFGSSATRARAATTPARAALPASVRAGEPASFECRLDRGAYEACGPMLRIRAGRGRHRLRVRATDALGQVDRTPAKRRWRVLPRAR